MINLSAARLGFWWRPIVPTNIYTITPNTTTIAEGSSVTMTVTTPNTVANGTVLYWSIVGTDGFNPGAVDFVDFFGTVTVNNFTGTFTITPVADNVNDTPETFYVELRIDNAIGTLVAQSINITINADGTTGGGGGCVVLESYIPWAIEQTANHSSLIQAYQVRAGHKIYLGNETTLAVVLGTVNDAINELQPCVRITTKTGVSLVCSTTAPIPTFDSGTLLAPHLLNKQVGVLKDGSTYWDEVVQIELVGEKFVRAIDTGDHSFWAGESNGQYILHHNMSVNAGDLNKN